MLERCLAQRWCYWKYLDSMRISISIFIEVLINTVTYILRSCFRMQTLTFPGRSGFSSSFSYWECYISMWAVVHNWLDCIGLCYQGTRSNSVSLIIWMAYLLACLSQLSPRQDCSRWPCARQCGYCPPCLAWGSGSGSLAVFYFSSIDMDHIQTIYHGT